MTLGLGFVSAGAQAAKGGNPFPNKAPDVEAPALYSALRKFFDTNVECKGLDEQTRQVFDAPAGEKFGEKKCEKARAFRDCVRVFRKEKVKEFQNVAETCATDPVNCVTNEGMKDLTQIFSKSNDYIRWVSKTIHDHGCGADPAAAVAEDDAEIAEHKEDVAALNDKLETLTERLFGQAEKNPQAVIEDATRELTASRAQLAQNCADGDCSDPASRQLMNKIRDLEKVLALAQEKAGIKAEIAEIRDEGADERAAKLRIESNNENREAAQARAEKIEDERKKVENLELEVLRLTERLNVAAGVNERARLTEDLAQATAKLALANKNLGTLEDRQDAQHMSVNESELLVAALAKDPKLNFGENYSTCTLARKAARSLGDAAYSAEYGTADCKPAATN